MFIDDLFNYKYLDSSPSFSGDSVIFIPQYGFGEL